MENGRQEKLFSKEFFRKYELLASGCFIFTLGAVLFAEPYGFAPGGTYGIAQVFHHLFGWRTEVSALCMDIPLLLVGIYFLGGKFGIKTVICTFLIPLFMWIIHSTYGFAPLLEPEVTERSMLQEQMLSSIFGGVTYGLGLGMVFRSGATSGGSDIISMILNKFTHISLGVLVMIVDCTITLTTVIAFGDWRLPMYSWIIIIIEGKVIDLVVDGVFSNKTVLIISQKSDEIQDFIINDMQRGATIMEATGAFSGENKKIIYTIVSMKELISLRKRIKEIDETAFVNVINSSEILGKGFKRI